VHLACVQNQIAPPKCKQEDGARSTTTSSIPNETPDTLDVWKPPPYPPSLATSNEYPLR
jgi:hypothetical protein